MKGGGGSFPAKRRWKWLVVAVLGLVILSMLVPLLFLLGLHNGFRSISAYGTNQPNSASNTIQDYDQRESSNSGSDSEDFVKSLVKEARSSTTSPLKEAKNRTISAVMNTDMPKPLQKANSTETAAVQTIRKDHGASDDTEKSCEVRFGSYCLWLIRHKEKLKDDMVKKMKDLLFVARAYYPSIAKLPTQDKLSREMKQNIQEFEKVLSDATTDADLPSHMDKKLQTMENVIARAKSLVMDCNNVDKKFRQLVDLTEDEANFHMKQSAFLYQLAVQTMPKSLHCLAMRLTVEYFRSPPPDLEQSQAEKFTDPSLRHFIIFSDNVLSSSAVINSTVTNAKGSENQVFHVLTDKQNYFAMKQWFLLNTFKEASVEVLNVEEFNLEENDSSSPLRLSLPNEIRISFPSIDKFSRTEIRTEYISVFGRSHFFLPKMFPNLNKVVILDDDVIVQRDLLGLWSLDMREKVIGAVQFCGVRLGQLTNYLGENAKDENGCAWMSGLNIVDLVRWREQDITETFLKLERLKQRRNEGLEDGTIRASLIVFQDQIYALDNTWSLSGLGHDYNLSVEALNKAAVLHYNGKMKPWIEIGIPKYKRYWKRFLNRENQFLSDCNVNP